MTNKRTHRSAFRKLFRRGNALQLALKYGHIEDRFRDNCGSGGHSGLQATHRFMHHKQGAQKYWEFEVSIT